MNDTDQPQLVRDGQAEATRLVYALHIVGEIIGALNLYIAEPAHVVEEVGNHLDALYHLDIGAEPVEVTIRGGGGDQVQITIRREQMTQAALDALPEFGGY